MSVPAVIGAPKRKAFFKVSDHDRYFLGVSLIAEWLFRGQKSQESFLRPPWPGPRYIHVDTASVWASSSRDTPGSPSETRVVAVPLLCLLLLLILLQPDGQTGSFFVRTWARINAWDILAEKLPSFCLRSDNQIEVGLKDNGLICLVEKSLD